MLEPIKQKLSELELITAIREKKLIGAELLYDEYALTLLKVIYCTVYDQKASETILVDVFHKIWYNIDDYQPKNGRLIIWMAGIARSIAKTSVALPLTTSKTQAGVQIFQCAFAMRFIFLMPNCLGHDKHRAMPLQ